jgi:hypothetical protein
LTQTDNFFSSSRQLFTSFIRIPYSYRVAS